MPEAETSQTVEVLLSGRVRGVGQQTLAAALRLGWLVVPPPLLAAVAEEKLLADRGTARIEQLAFAGFLQRGELDRFLRRKHIRYGTRRAALDQGILMTLTPRDCLRLDPTRRAHGRGVPTHDRE